MINLLRVSFRWNVTTFRLKIAECAVGKYIFFVISQISDLEFHKKGILRVLIERVLIILVLVYLVYVGSRHDLEMDRSGN